MTTFTQLDAGIPLLLLPVRLETRFTPRDAVGARVLKIRIYPDDVHQDSHEPGLTAAESTGGKEFWAALWRAGRGVEGEQQRLTAWQLLVARHGAHRARWIAERLTPVNPGQRPDERIPADAPLSPPPQWPDVPSADAAWTRASRIAVLPDRWLATGHFGGRKVFEQRGAPITRPLATGPDPADDLNEVGQVGPGMRWMVDFAAAELAGMGISVRLPPGSPDRFDRITVLGVAESLDAAEATAALSGLLDAHAATWGLDLVPQGTPTNNDGPGRPGGRRPRTLDGAGVLAALDAAPAAPGDGSDAAALAHALGVTERTSPLWRLPHAAGTEGGEASAMAAALWPATWGYYLRELFSPGFDGMPLADWRRFTIDTVRARGPLPAVRVGDQPYGVLPVTSLTQWRPHPSRPDLLF
ncbi:hypothetical protein DEJ48_38910 [Streptomyces venezuelae]|uniref:Uncharacterized protein n=1 Tax=Streptomyces venezuelae TaxID=54571 RepID=A0A5P2C8M0_STRVZ|nr:hypothetical protein [Streptomyces venezuelae]QES38590.1 hypothetical protein DEJ48_38910 [Streptomyces venezuelae]